MGNVLSIVLPPGPWALGPYFGRTPTGAIPTTSAPPASESAALERGTPRLGQQQRHKLGRQLRVAGAS